MLANECRSTLSVVAACRANLLTGLQSFSDSARTRCNRQFCGQPLCWSLCVCWRLPTAQRPRRPAHLSSRKFWIVSPGWLWLRVLCAIGLASRCHITNHARGGCPFAAADVSTRDCALAWFVVLACVLLRALGINHCPLSRDFCARAHVSVVAQLGWNFRRRTAGSFARSRRA